MMRDALPHQDRLRTRHALRRFSLGVALVVVLALGLWGYTTPSMRLAWESVATMCGF
ncbi:MAG: hypothetical protein IT507_18330 [Burkholderiaceae bacterium]|nr:hypothetical protein [Burkholderiaceae bacterium]